MFGGYAFTPKLSVDAKAVIFGLDIGDYSGSLFDITGNVRYDAAKHFALGAGVRYFNVDLSADASDFHGEFNYQYLGPQIFGILKF